ncbi:MAG: M28 family peptidase [Gemmatimonadaceae bacterium]|nr:M28 family peptidase [Gemmatimonadaceae bacterium]
MRFRPFALSLLVLVACAKGDQPAPDAAAPAVREFDGEAALRYVGEHIAVGPRVPGTAAHRAGGDWIVNQMRSRADTVLVQEWTHTTKTGKKLPLRNILARFQPERTDRILYVTHWDSRPVADAELDPAKQMEPILGANDGGSGVGLFVAIADALKKKAPDVGVDLLFVDGEDWGTFGPPDIDVLIGSTYFAANLPHPTYRPLYGVLFDMIGDADLRVPQEDNSVAQAPEVVQKFWSTARRLGYEQWFPPRAEGPITDDHIPLLAKGLRVIDVIDITYPPHHTLGDTIDKLSAKSLQMVGDIALALIREP